MKHSASPEFWEAYDRLPLGVQRAADAAFTRLKANPRHPALRVKKVGRFWSARVGLQHRALAVETDQGLLWVWIGSHPEYEAII